MSFSQSPVEGHGTAAEVWGRGVVQSAACLGTAVRDCSGIAEERPGSSRRVVWGSEHTSLVSPAELPPVAENRMSLACLGGGGPEFQDHQAETSCVATGSLVSLVYMRRG